VAVSRWTPPRPSDTFGALVSTEGSIRTLLRPSLAVAAIALCTGGPAPAQYSAADPAGVSENEIVVTGFPEIVVNGRAVRCRPATDDPLDNVSVPGWQSYMMIVPDDQDGFVATRVTERITGPDFWQRVGVGMGAYQFRAPQDGQPMCIGGRGDIYNFGGFRRIVDATPYRGRRVRFTAWAATGSARQVNFWLAAGSNQLFEGEGLFEEDKFLNGGNSNNVPFGGNHGWTPVLIEIGPIHERAGHISYGFNLQGSGNVWVHDAKLEIVDDRPELARTGDVVVIGRDRR